MIRPRALAKIASSTGPISRSGVTKPGDLGVRRVGQQQVDALRAEPREAGEVGDPAVERQLVHLEVAGVQHDAGRRLDGDRERVRDRVVDREELALERAEPLGGAFLDRQRVRRDPPLGQLRLDERERELRADERDVRLVGQQVGHRADVVLVPVGEHDRLYVVEPIDDRLEVRQDQIDTGLVDVREQDAAVDDEELAFVLEDGHVATDRAEATERHHPQRARGQRAWHIQVDMRLTHARATSGRAVAASSPGLLAPGAR